MSAFPPLQSFPESALGHCSNDGYGRKAVIAVCPLFDAQRTRSGGAAALSEFGRLADLVAASAFGLGSKGKVHPERTFDWADGCLSLMATETV